MNVLICFFFVNAIAFAVSWVLARRSTSRKQFWWFHDRFSLCYLTVVLSMCAWSVLNERQMGYEAMTPVQSIALLIVCAVFCADYGFYCGGISVVRRDVFFIHHPLSLVGCCYQLWKGIGGGLMVHLLLDGLDGFFSSLGDVFPSLAPLCSYLEPLFSFLMRIIWYPFISYLFLRDYILSDSKRDVDFGWRCIVLIWCVIANGIHYFLLFQTVKKKFFTAKEKKATEAKTK